MATFPGDPVALADGTAYERIALQPACDLLFGTARYVASTTKVDLSNFQTGKNLYLLDVVRGSRTAISDQAVVATLNNMRALLFVTAFKLQDMIVEWILGENGNSEWAFSKKLAFYINHKGDAAWTEPDLLLSTSSYGKAFWEIYEALTDARNTINHKSAFQVSPAGVITVTGRKNSYTLDSTLQAAYTELMITLVESFSQSRASDFPINDIIQRTLSTFSVFHTQNFPGVAHYSYEGLEITVPQVMLNTIDPCVAVIDLVALKAQLAQFSSSAVKYMTSFKLIAGSRTLKTSLEPFSDLPDSITIDETDSTLTFIQLP